MVTMIKIIIKPNVFIHDIAVLTLYQIEVLLLVDKQETALAKIGGIMKFCTESGKITKRREVRITSSKF